MTQAMSRPMKAGDGTYVFVIHLFLLLRLKSKETDVCITVNVPVAHVNEEAQQQNPLADPQNRNLALGHQMLELFADSFAIVDWSFLG